MRSNSSAATSTPVGPPPTTMKDSRRLFSCSNTINLSDVTGLWALCTCVLVDVPCELQSGHLQELQLVPNPGE